MNLLERSWRLYPVAADRNRMQTAEVKETSTRGSFILCFGDFMNRKTTTAIPSSMAVRISAICMPDRYIPIIEKTLFSTVKSTAVNGVTLKESNTN